MASQLINLNQLSMAMTRMKTYCNGTYSLIGHDHNTLYYTKSQIDNELENLKLTLSAKADTSHVHTSADVNKMTGYSKPTITSAILETDTLNAAIGKLEKALDDAGSAEHNHDGIYLKINDAAASAKKLDSARVINLGGAITGSASFDGSADITINTAVANITSDKITTMTGYVKPDSTGDISSTDSLNVAIGKLEKALDGKQAAGDYAPGTHDHNTLYHTKQEISDMLANIESGGSASLEAAKAYTDAAISNLVGEGTPEALDTLKEIATALGEDPNLAGTLTTEIGKKADKVHTHDEATTSTAGFMSAADKTKLNGLSNYVHPDTAGYKHIPAGGSSGQALIWSADGTAEWGSVSSTDQYVKNTLNTAVKAYLTGTTSSATNTGEQVFDTGVYLTTNAGELQATTFIGNLSGTATKASIAESCSGNAATASVANKTKNTLTIKLNDTTQGSFDGSIAKTINITAASVGAPTTTQFTDATTQATDVEVTSMLDEIFS